MSRRPMILNKKIVTAAYSFNDTFEAMVEVAHPRLLFVLKRLGHNIQAAEDLRQDVFLKMGERYLANPEDFMSKTSTPAQWIGYYISSAVKHNLNTLKRAVNVLIAYVDMEAMMNDVETRSIPGLQVEECFDILAPKRRKELYLELLEKHMSEEEKEQTKQVLFAWFVEQLDQQEITAKYGVPPGTISSIIYRFKDSSDLLFKHLNMDALDAGNDDVEELYTEARERVAESKKQKRKRKKD